jgi:sugar phosphate isomerase/epimerase
MISNAWPESRRESGATLRAIEAVLQHYPIFEAFQTVDIPFAAERKAIARLLRAQGRPHTYTLTRVLAEQQLNLSSLDPGLRRRSCEVVAARLDDACEAGAQFVGLISGPCPSDANLRPVALQALGESLASLADAARQRDLKLILEPLDFAAHKRATLGTAVEAVALCDLLAAVGAGVALCLDVAHLTLNGEDIIGAVVASRAHLAEFHFCNAVVDPTHPLFGDRHLFFGPPGVIGPNEIAGLMSDLARIGFLTAAARPRVYCEVWKPGETDSLDVVRHCANALVTGWQSACKQV